MALSKLLSRHCSSVSLKQLTVVQGKRTLFNNQNFILYSSPDLKMAASIPAESLNITKRQLFAAPLEEIKNIVSPALKENFSEASVEIVDCPDLTKEPFTLAAAAEIAWVFAPPYFLPIFSEDNRMKTKCIYAGLSGNSEILEVGGPSFLLPSVHRDKVYELKPIIKRLTNGNDNQKAFVIGAGGGPWPRLSRNCEMMMNVAISPEALKNQSRLAWVGPAGQCVLEESLESDTRFALLANLYMCEGKPGKVLKVHAKRRTGKLDFIATMQKALEAHYKDKLVGLGGTFLLKQGKAKQHVMPDFSSTPLNTEKSLNNWLKFYDMSAPLIAVGTFVSAETDLDLRVQHFHSFSHHGEGGHYHIDTTPESVEYLGYFNVADSLYRIDQPSSRLTFGKD